MASLAPAPVARPPARAREGGRQWSRASILDAMENLARLRHFVQAFTALVAAVGQDEVRLFDSGRALLASLIAHDDWLPAQFAEADPARYRQYLLHCDPLERFSVS